MKLVICTEFETKIVLDQHFAKHHNENIKSVQENKKPFKCKICDHSFSQKVQLKRHVVSVHGKKRPYKFDN